MKGMSTWTRCAISSNRRASILLPTLDQLQDLCIDQYHVNPSTSVIDDLIQEAVSIDEESTDRRKVI